MPVRSLASLSGLRIGVAINCGVGRRHGSDPLLLWLWHRLAATAPIRPLTWEPPYAVVAALEKEKKKKRQILLFSEKKRDTETQSDTNGFICVLP